MAVENVDIGSLIAGAIDRFYEQLDREQAWYEQECRKVDLVVEGIFAKYRKGLIEGTDDLGDDPEYDDEAKAAMAQWKAAQGGGAQQPGAPKQRRPRQPKAAVADQSVYRRGYKTGWKAAHTNQPANPPDQDPEYVRGYMDGHKVSGHANAVAGHYGAALQAHAAGDHDGAAAHVGKSGEHVNALVQHHLPDWAAETAAKRGLGHDAAAQAFQANVGAMMRPTVKRSKAGVPIAGNRSAMVDAIHGLASRAGAVPDEAEDHPDHPANFGSQLGRMIGGYAAREKKKELKQAAKGHGGEGGGEEGGGGGGPERSVAAQQPLLEYKENLEHQAFGKGAVDAHNQGIRHHPDIQAFRDHPHEHHEEARQHAHDMWRNGIVNFIQSAAKNNEENALFRGKVPSGAPDQANPNSPHMVPGEEVDFSPAQYLIDRLHDEKGFGGYKSGVRAVQKQLGPNFTFARAKKLDAGSNGTEPMVHPAAGKLTGITKRAETWLHENHQPAATDHPMWDHHFGLIGAEKPGTFQRRGQTQERSPEAQAREAAGRAARRGQVKLNVRKAAEEAIRHMFGLFGDWLRENVELAENQLPAVMESIFSKLHESYDLVEDREASYDDFINGVES
jgi:hypothetical protein